MKSKKVSNLFILGFILIGFAACTKPTSKDEPNGEVKVNASKVSAIKRGEPVNFKFTSATASSNIEWSVEPATKVVVKTFGNVASAQFDRSGAYKITAKSGLVSGSSSVSVNDSVYTPVASQTLFHPLTTGDQILMSYTKFWSTDMFSSNDTVHIYFPYSNQKISDTPNGNAYGLKLKFTTEKKHPYLNSTLSWFGAAKESELTINIAGVWYPNADYRIAGEEQVSQEVYVYPLTKSVYVLNVALNGTPYKGTIEKNGETVSVKWTSTSGVILR